MDYREASRKMAGLQTQIAALREEMRKAQLEAEPQEVDDYTLKSTGGDVSLSSLFGARDTLFVVHNMGASCPYCTLWADGFNGVSQHLQDRAAFVVSSPDAPHAQAEFAGSRGWTFPMVSHQGSSFATDMGYGADGGWMPGVSVFKRDGDRILRVADTVFGPGDDYCAVWHLFNLIPEGPNGWQPQFSYG